MGSAFRFKRSQNVRSTVSAERQANTVDDYSTLVARYGYPNSALASELLAIVPVRTARYTSVHLNVVVVPNGCVGAYEEAAHYLAERSRYPALAKQQTKSTMRCASSPSDGWTIVAYADSAESEALSADIARIRLNDITAKQTRPPILEVESVQTRKQAPRNLAKKQLQPKSDAQIDKQTWALRDNVKRNAENAEVRARYSPYAVLMGGIGLFIVGIVIHRKNTEKRTSRLFYELDEAEQQKYATIHEALAHLGKSHRIWRIESSSATSDWKRNAGASSLVRRVPISVVSANPPRVETNLAVPCIDIATAKLFFLPDTILYLERGTYGGIEYDDFSVDQRLTRIQESQKRSARSSPWCEAA